MQDPRHEMTAEEKKLAEMAEFNEADLEEENDDAPLQEVPTLRFSKRVSNVFSMKVGAEELDELADAADAAGVSLSTFIREAALEKARRREPEDKRIQKVRQKGRELQQALDRL